MRRRATLTDDLAKSAPRAKVPIVPPRIERGQTIGICAPAGPVKPEKLKAGLARLGDAFRLHLAPSLTAPRESGVPSYLAASDDTRVAELNAMLAAPDVRAIVLARGGYGLMRILPRLDASLLRRDPKPIVGFSDATALLAWAHANGVRGIHGPMIAQLADLPDGDVGALIAMLTDPLARARFEVTAHGSGVHRGPLIAGNLTLASMLVGTTSSAPRRVTPNGMPSFCSSPPISCMTWSVRPDGLGTATRSSSTRWT